MSSLWISSIYETFRGFWGELFVQENILARSYRSQRQINKNEARSLADENHEKSPKFMEHLLEFYCAFLRLSLQSRTLKAWKSVYALSFFSVCSRCTPSINVISFCRSSLLRSVIFLKFKWSRDCARKTGLEIPSQTAAVNKNTRAPQNLFIISNSWLSDTSHTFQSFLLLFASRIACLRYSVIDITAEITFNEKNTKKIFSSGSSSSFFFGLLRLTKKV